MAVLDRKAILGAQDMQRELVPVPEWGGDVYVSVLTGTERDAFEAAVAADKEVGDDPNIRARFAALVIRGEDGKRIFADEDVAALGAKSTAALDRVFEAGSRLNRMRKQDVEELEKN